MGRSVPGRLYWGPLPPDAHGRHALPRSRRHPGALPVRRRGRPDGATPGTEDDRYAPRRSRRCGRRSGRRRFGPTPPEPSTSRSRPSRSWPPEHVTMVVRRVVERLHRLLEVRDVVNSQELAELTDALRRGLSLHTDIAIAQRNSQAPMGRPGAVILVDGQETRYIGRSAHWPIARQIAAELATRPGEGPRVAAWYRATAAVMQQWGDSTCWAGTSRPARRCSWTTRCSRCTRARSVQLFGDSRLHEVPAQARLDRRLRPAAGGEPQGPGADGGGTPVQRDQRRARRR